MLGKTAWPFSLPSNQIGPASTSWLSSRPRVDCRQHRHRGGGCPPPPATPPGDAGSRIWLRSELKIVFYELSAGHFRTLDKTGNSMASHLSGQQGNRIEDPLRDLSSQIRFVVRFMAASYAQGIRARQRSAYYKRKPARTDLLPFGQRCALRPPTAFPAVVS